MEILYRQVDESDAAQASAVVRASFIGLAAQDWETPAQEWFLGRAMPEIMAKNIREAVFAEGAFSDRQMVGFLLMPSPSLLGMLFVDPRFVRRNIAITLWKRARAHIENHFPSVKAIELNTTPYALGFYRAAGFVPLAEIARGGARATRMICHLL